MIASMSILATLHAEIRSAHEQARPVLHIRVTADAIPGSITTTPISPERQRALAKLRMLPDGTVVGSAEASRLLEILVHPEDWRDLLVDPDAQLALSGDEVPGYPSRVLGVKVWRMGEPQ